MRIPLEEGVALQAYSDDFVLLVEGKNVHLIWNRRRAAHFATLMTEALSKTSVSARRRRCLAGLEIRSHGKTVAEYLQKIPVIKFMDKSVKCRSSGKYLGVWIDQHLNWKAHMAYMKEIMQNMAANIYTFSRT